MSAPLPSAGGAIVKFLLRNSTRHDRPRTPLRLLMHARELTASLKLFRQYVSAELMFMLLSTARATGNHVSCGLKKAVGLTCPYLKDCNSATKCYNDLIFWSGNSEKMWLHDSAKIIRHVSIRAVLQAK